MMDKVFLEDSDAVGYIVMSKSGVFCATGEKAFARWFAGSGRRPAAATRGCPVLPLEGGSWPPGLLMSYSEFYASYQFPYVLACISNQFGS
jgi:hypothetical protein